MNMKKILGLSVLLAVATLAHAQSTFNKFQPAAGVQCNTGSTYVDTACTGSQIPAAGSTTQLQYNLSGALTGNAQATVASDLGVLLGSPTGGSKGPGTLNATALYINGAAVGTSSGAVSSVALADGSTTPIFTITGSPVTAAGTLTETLMTQTANKVFASATSGGAAQPAFRALVAADLPALGGNPSASFGVNLTGANGSATTYLRSDAVLTLDQSIVPTWSGFHTWTSSSAGAALQALCNTSNTTGARCWDVRVGSTGTYTLTTATDAGVKQNDAFGLTRDTSGNFTGAIIPQPASGVALNITGSTGAGVLTLNGGNATNSYTRYQTAGTNIGFVGDAFAVFAGSSGDLGIGGGSKAIHMGASSDSLDIGTAGNITVNAPGSSTALTVNGLSANNTIVAASTGAAAGIGIGWAAGITAGAWNIWTQSTDPLTVGTQGSGSLLLTTNAVARITASSTGIITVAAPSSANPTVTINAASAAGGDALVLNGPTSSDSRQDFDINGTLNALVASIGSAGDLVTGSQVGDYVIRTQGGSLLFSANSGSSVQMKIQTGGQTTMYAPSGNPFGILTGVGGSTLFQVQNSGSVGMPGLGTSTAAQTGYMCWSSTGGAITIDSTNTCLVSSLRYKKNVLPLELGIDAVMKLRPISYEYKDGFMPDKFNPGRQDGFIAEEVQKVDPRLVPLDSEGKPKSVEYAQMTALLARAIQDQQQEIWELKLALGALAVVSLTWLSALTWKRRRGHQ